MRKIAYIVTISLCFSCIATGNYSVRNDYIIENQIDTIKCAVLNDTMNLKVDKYRLLYLYYVTEDIKTIELQKNFITECVLVLPKADIDVKNFSVNDIKKTKEGFAINVSWGGGFWFYNRVFNFIFNNNSFYLNKIVESHYYMQKEDGMSKEKIIAPPIEISKFELLDYIDND
jgi:hypothetical protein